MITDTRYGNPHIGITATTIEKKYNNHDIYKKPLFLLAFFIIKASKNTVRLLYLFHFFIIYQLRRANNKTTTTSSKIFIRSEIPRARRPVMA
ncbi:hypothetical protein CIH92_10315 [Salmonella enterica]|nr:hypothetical protein [Salmonella enterica]